MNNFLFLCLLFFYSTFAFGIDFLPAIDVIGCSHIPDRLKLYYGPNNDFAVAVFCDDAGGTNIGVINITMTDKCYQNGLSPSHPAYDQFWLDHPWLSNSESNRFWQHDLWARDVESFNWSRDGIKLMVKTNYVYGTDRIYILDLCNRKIYNVGPACTNPNNDPTCQKKNK